MTTTIYNMGLRFKEVAARHPDRVALAIDGKTIPYRVLDEHSDRVATLLMQAGLAPGKVLALLAEKHATTYAAMLAALKIGAPYVVLDTQSPRARLDKILERCQPSLIITDSDVTFGKVPILSLKQLDASAAPVALSVIEEVKGDTPAYLMFTSGSTGFPKGATIMHSSMLNLCRWARETFAITPDDRLTNVNPLYFDNSVFDFTAALFNGASLKPAGRDVTKQPKQLVEHVKDCSVWFSVPSLLIYLTSMKALSKENWPRMRAIIFGGEGYAKAELKKLHTLYGTQATLWNVYGPTECTCICSAYVISERDFADMSKLAPLGHLAPDFTGAAMDATGTRAVPDGETGELFLFGPQVALGYYNDPERTQAAFAKSPLHPDQPCYRTGDLVVREAKTGYFHFAGRRDNQIKHMGYRIELEEIEAALAGFGEVTQPAVIYHKTAQAGRIVAFVMATADGESLKSRLREILPSYMIPEEVRVVDALPRNANGKVDRKALAQQYGEEHA